MPNSPIQYAGDFTYEKFRNVIGKNVPDSWIEAQVASGHLVAAAGEAGAPPTLTGASVAQFIADRAPGGEFFVGPWSTNRRRRRPPSSRWRS